jgi:uncharacterized OsmC-like protein
MRGVAQWEGGVHTKLDDGRGHAVTVHRPRDEGAADAGTTALELCALSFAGCNSTLFGLGARRRGPDYPTLRISLDAERPRGAPTITRISGLLEVGTRAKEDEVDTVARLTLRTRPVEVMSEQAGVPMSITTLVVRPGSGPAELAAHAV